MALRELLAVFDVNVRGGAELRRVDAAMDQARGKAGGLDRALSGVKSAFAAVGTALAVRQMAGFVVATATAADEAGDLADSLGLPIEAFQALKALGDRTGADMVVGLRTLAKAAESGADAFSTLGVRTKDSDGSLRSMSDLATDSLVALADMTDETQRIAIATQLFGRSGNQLIPIMAGGSAAMREQIATVQKLGIAFDKETAESSGKWLDTLGLVQIQVMRLRGNLLNFFMPTLQATADWFVGATNAAGTWIKQSQNFGTSAKAIGVVGAALGLVAVAHKWGSLVELAGHLAKAGKVGLIAVAAFLVIEDFFAFLEGRKSVIGEALEALGLIKDAETDGKAFGEALKGTVVPAIRDMGSAVARFAQETIVSFGAIANAAMTSNAAMRDDYIAVFMANSGTIDAFGARWFSIVTWLPSVWLGAMGQVTEGMAIFGSGMILWLEGIITGTNRTTSGFAALASTIQSIGADIKQLITDPLAFIAGKVTGTSAGDMIDVARGINVDNANAADARGRRPPGTPPDVSRIVAESFGPVSPTAPAAGGFTVNDHSTIEVNVGPNATPAATGRAVAAAVTTAKSGNARTLAAVSR